MREIPWVHETIPLRTPNINCLTTKHDNTHVNGFGLTTGPIPFEKKKKKLKKKKKKKNRELQKKRKGSKRAHQPVGIQTGTVYEKKEYLKEKKDYLKKKKKNI